jgi:hypothetical protein
MRAWRKPADLRHGGGKRRHLQDGVRRVVGRWWGRCGRWGRRRRCRGGRRGRRGPAGWGRLRWDIVGEGRDERLVLHQDEDCLAHPHLLRALWHKNCRNVALLLRLPADGSFVGFDIADQVTRRQLITNLYLIHSDVSLYHGRREGRHLKLDMRWQGREIAASKHAHSRLSDTSTTYETEENSERGMSYDTIHRTDFQHLRPGSFSFSALKSSVLCRRTVLVSYRAGYYLFYSDHS